MHPILNCCVDIVIINMIIVSVLFNAVIDILVM